MRLGRVQRGARVGGEMVVSGIHNVPLKDSTIGRRMTTTLVIVAPLINREWSSYCMGNGGRVMALKSKHSFYSDSNDKSSIECRITL